MVNFKIRGLLGLASVCCLVATAQAQNVGIGVTNPQKGRVEIAGALGGHTTVLTIGSDGTGISLQRNWPTIGLNQYRDAANKQRFIGAGYAGSIYLSQDDGSIVFTQMGSGSANQEILNVTYPFIINAGGSTIVNGWAILNNMVMMKQNLVFSNAPMVTSNALGMQYNLLPVGTGHIAANGAKTRGTANYTASYNAAIAAYVLNFPDEVGSELILTITPRSQDACMATYSYNGFGLYFVYIWNKYGTKLTRDFTFTAFR